MEDSQSVARMPLFSGEHAPTLDEKGRFAIPSRFRSAATWVDGKETWVLTRGFEQCLVLFTGETWHRIMQEKLSGLSMGNRKHRIFLRHFVGPAVELQADKQGRIVIPQNLREYAGINRDLMVLGAGKYIEVWGSSQFAAEFAENGDLGPIEETLAELDI